MLKSVIIDNRNIIIGGLGKMFYQNGLPLQVSIERCKQEGFEVSLFHIADEFLKNGWKTKTVITKLRDELDRSYNLEELEKFVEMEYEEQRDMIFKYLFSNSFSAEKYLRENL